MRTILILSAVLWLSLSACRKQSTKDQKIIEDYIEDNNIQATKTESGLWYRIDPQGTGASPTLNDEVAVHYKGYLTDGTVFDETNGQQPLTTPLAMTIDGWQEGLPLLQEGGSMLLLIPSELGYGDRHVGNIPPNSVLVFEIDLVEVK